MSLFFQVSNLNAHQSRAKIKISNFLYETNVKLYCICPNGIAFCKSSIKKFETQTKQAKNKCKKTWYESHINITTKTKTFIFQFSYSFWNLFDIRFIRLLSFSFSNIFFDIVLTFNVNSCHFQWTKCIHPYHKLCTLHIALL